jgi:hypothetical protein
VAHFAPADRQKLLTALASHPQLKHKLQMLVQQRIEYREPFKGSVYPFYSDQIGELSQSSGHVLLTVE